jgi:hypothetical protein
LRATIGIANIGELFNFMRRLLSSSLLILFTIVCSRAGELRLDLNHTGSEASVQLSGDAGQEYLIESARDSAEQWTPVTSFILSDPSRLWKDAAAGTGNRFFRARTADPQQDASDFRLIDQNGVSRGLYYYASLNSLNAVVLTFAEGNYSSFAPKIAQLKSNPAFANNKVFFWTIEIGATNTRPNILKDATAAGITWPVYHDPMQLVTHDYDAHFSGETFVISRSTMKIVYRGVIDDGTSNYVAAALTSLNAGAPVVTTRLEPTLNTLTPRPRVVADYSTVIAPLLQTKCVVCHSSENIAPLSFTNHESVVTYAASIKQELLANRMPPFYADPQYGKFHNDTSLSNAEKAELADWLDAGAPRGNGPDLLTNVPPLPPKWPAELGEPDQIVTIPVQQIPAIGTNAYRYIYANATNAEGKWLRAAVVHPGNRKVVHHYIVWQGHSNAAMLSGVALYAPGRNEQPFPDGTGVYLPPNCDLTFNLHYTSDGVDETDQPELGLWYASTPPAHELKRVAAINYLFTLGSMAIPAGAPDFEVTANASILDGQASLGGVGFNSPVRLYSLSPHMHFRGSRMRFELTLPGVAGKQILLSVPTYRFDWQTIYNFEQPIDLPAGASINVVGAFDNSEQNLDNPDPTIAVNWGEQSWDEMFIGYIEYSAQ